APQIAGGKNTEAPRQTRRPEVDTRLRIAGRGLWIAAPALRRSPRSAARRSQLMNPQSAIRNPQSLHPLQPLAQLFVKFAGVPLEAMIIRLYDGHALWFFRGRGEHLGFVERHVLILARLDHQVRERRDLRHIA